MRVLLFLLFASALLASCGDKKTPNGYPFTNHTKTGGQKPAVGDFAYVHIYVRQNDSLMNSTREMGKTIPLEVPDLTKQKEEEKGAGKANPVADVVGMIGKGDSVSVEIPLTEEMLKQAPQLKDVKKFVYDVVLVDVKTATEHQAAAAAEQAEMEQKMAAAKAMEGEIAKQVADIQGQYKAGKLNGKLQAADQGLKYMMLQDGGGAPTEHGKPVAVQYYGVLAADGQEFDNSYKKGGKPYVFNLGTGSVIQGWHVGIAKLKYGDKAVLFVPAELAYGAGGRPGIPPNAELIFYVEIEKS